MALIQRNELTKYLQEHLGENGPKVFLLFGERFLCRKAADELEKKLFSWKKGTLYSIDGDAEDSSQTLAKLMSYSLLPGLQIYRIQDTKLFHSKNISQIVWEKACQANKADRQSLALKYLADLYHLASIPSTERIPLADMTETQWQESFGLVKPADLDWTTALFPSLLQHSGGSIQQSDMAEKFIEAFEKGLPKQTILILCAENIDKRKRLFGYIKKQELAVDCSVAEGSGAAAQKVQKSVLQEILQDTLKQFNKTIEPQALEIFFERVGFHPVAVSMEVEKLALYCDDRERITLKDMNEMVSRSREDALYELTDHFSKNNISMTLVTLHRLLEGGIHGLAILATMRNFIRRLLIFKTLQLKKVPAYNKNMAAQEFQNNYLPELKNLGEWEDMLKGHPYALFMSFAKASEYQCATLKKWLEMILDAEYQFKTSSPAGQVVLEQMFVNMLTGNDQEKNN